MKNKFFILGILLAAICLFSPACKKPCFDPQNPDCEDYDPCYGEKETSAAFGMYETIFCSFTDTMLRATDTTMGGYVQFIAQDFLEEYQWKVGQDARIFTTKSFRLNFTGFTGDVEIQLIGKKSPTQSCFPLDDGIDTVKRMLHLKSYTEDVHPFWNKKYRGYTTDEPDSIYTIEFTEIPIGGLGLNHFPRGCDRPDNWMIGINSNYTGFCLVNPDSSNFHDCGFPTGYGELHTDRKTLHIYYRVTENDERVSKEFVGTKIE